MASLSLATLVASFFAIGVAQAETFPDVQPSDWFYSYVEDLVALGVVNGSMPEYRAGDNVNRAEMAKLVVEAFDIDLVSPDEATFKDVASGTWYYEYVETAAAHGIVGGYKDDEGALTGYYGPADAVTREQAAKMIVLGAPLELNTNCGPSFPDVGVNRWSYEYVETLYVNSVVDGYPDGTFGPEANINRAEIAKIVSNGMAPMLRPCGGYSVASADAMSATTVEVCYTQDYDETSAMMPENYVVEDGNGDELAVTDVEATSDPMCVLLTTDAQDSTSVYDLMVSDVMSAEGEELLSGEATFDGYTVGNVGDLTVRLDGSSPESANIPKNGSNLPFSVFAFEAGADEAVDVEQVIVSRTGLGFPGDFQNLKLYVDGVQKGGEKTVNSTSNTATFNLSSDPIEVPAGSSVLVEVRADLGAAQNSENALCLGSPDDITAYGADTGEEVSVDGDFAVCGDVMTTTSATVGTLDYTVSQPSTADVNVGDTDVSLTKVRMDMANEDVEVNRVTFKQTGSADSEDFGNVSLWMSGSLYAEDPEWEGDFVTFDLSEDPIEIAKGNSKTVELRADIVGGLASTANFDIYRDWHIEGEGQVYYYGVNVKEDTTTSITPTPRNIVGGNIAFSLSSSNPITGDVKKGANDHEFTRFNISTGGDGVTVRKLSLTVNGTDFNHIDDVKIWTQNSDDEWYVVAGPNDVTTAALPQTVSFTDTFEVPEATTQAFMITADIANGATALDTYDIDVADVKVGANTELEYLSDGTPVNLTNDVTGGLLDGNVMTVKTPQLTVSLSATPGDKTYVKNTLDKDLVAFDMYASTADDLRVTSVVVSCADTPEVGDNGVDDDGDGVIDEGDVGAGDPAQGSCSTSFQSLELYEKDGSTLTKLDSSARSMSDAGSGDGTVTFSLNHTIEKGTSSRLLVRGDLASSAIQDGYTFSIGAGGVSAEDTDSATANVVGLVTGTRIVTLSDQGAVTSQGKTDSSLKGRVVAGLSSDQPALNIEFSASELEAWYVKKMEFYVDGDCDANLDGVADACAAKDVSSINLTYLNQDGDTETSSRSVVAGAGGVVLLEGLNIYVPAGSSQTVEVTLDMGDVATGGAIAGDVIKVTFAGASGTFEAIGAASAQVVTSSVDVTSNAIRVAKSYPFVSRNVLSSALADGEVELYSVNVEAADAGDISLKQLCFDVNISGPAVSNYRIIRGSEDLEANGEVTVSTGAFCGASGTGVLVQWTDGAVGGEDDIDAGNSKTYVLKGDVTGSASGDSINTTLLGDINAGADDGIVATATPYTVGGTAEAFVWSDQSLSGTHDSDEVTAPTSADFLDGYLVEELSTVGSQIVSL